MVYLLIEMEKEKVVLVIDDDLNFADMFAVKLKKAGLRSIVMASGQEALDYLLKNDADFIVVDFIMPEMDGYTFYHVLTKDMKKIIPAIILTSMYGTKEEEGLEVFVKTETNIDDLVGRIKSKLTS